MKEKTYLEDMLQVRADDFYIALQAIRGIDAQRRGAKGPHTAIVFGPYLLEYFIKKHQKGESLEPEVMQHFAEAFNAILENGVDANKALGITKGSRGRKTISRQRKHSKELILFKAVKDYKETTGEDDKDAFAHIAKEHASNIGDVQRAYQKWLNQPNPLSD